VLGLCIVKLNDSYSEEVQLCLGELTLGGLIRTVKDVVGV